MCAPGPCWRLVTVRFAPNSPPTSEQATHECIAGWDLDWDQAACGLERRRALLQNKPAELCILNHIHGSWTSSAIGIRLESLTAIGKPCH